mmetsp:Transcript_70624/g.193749  ORF Transcript_70624/g.193749 Transcript_70624/m.193749 type:complete len:325 (+) Transcript_70624:70-1044(+)
MDNDLEENLALAQARGNEPSKLGFEVCRKILAAVREARAARPDLVRRFGSYLLDNHSSRLGHELWMTYEQVYVALLQYGKSGKNQLAADASMPEDLAAAQEYGNILSAQFPESLRVKRLDGMLWEAKGMFDMASKEYEAILAEDPNNILATKRMIALCRARGQPGEAASRLVKYLDMVCSDTEAWLQLSAIYLNSQQFKRAAFCTEELILVNPMSYLYHLRYADIMYTMGCADKGGGTEQLRIARKYYAHALDLKPQNNLRAVYGLLLASSALGTSAAKGAKGSTKTDNVEVFNYARTQIVQLYANQPGPMAKMVQGMLTALVD